MAKKQWVRGERGRGARPPEAEKAVIVAACDRLIDEFFVPRFLPGIRPTAFNYPVAIRGKWHGNRFRFIQRFRSDRADDAFAPEFDAPFARLDYVGRDRFDVSYYRHTEKWFCLYRYVSLAQALQLLRDDGHFHPV